jgi:FtsH-binding integral membrane protein
MLTEIAGAVILVAVVLVVAAWFGGPSRFAVPARRWLAPYLEANPVATYSVVVAVLLLIFIWQPIPATGTPVGMIVFTVLALIGTEALRRQTRVEFRTAPGLREPATG